MLVSWNRWISSWQLFHNTLLKKADPPNLLISLQEDPIIKEDQTHYFQKETPSENNKAY